ncbi:MAG TPA: hypothetical protein VKU36_03655 [Candidatus Babeliales bacterium]|nr:hypothetical protein [Candidatus Babeliales bacterium]
MKRIILLSFIFAVNVHAMEVEHYSPSTYKGKEITPISLLKLSPKMPHQLKKETDLCLDKYGDFIIQLVTTPHPLTHENRKQKTKDNFAIIKEYEDKGEVKNVSTFNYVLHFTDFPRFTVPINRWGSRMAYWMYASGQGNVLDPNFNADSVDCSKFEYMPTYQHCSRVAHYLRLKEIIKKKNFKHFQTTPTYLKHIPGKPELLADENYIVIQEWIPGLKELNHMSAEEQKEIRKNIPFEALKEIHEGIIYAALWNIRGNLSVDGVTPYYYYLVNLEEPFNHKPQFFYFQGEEGRKKYTEDVVAALERMAKSFLDIPEQFERWIQLTNEHAGFKKYCDKYNVYPNFDPEYLLKRD